MGTRPVTSSRVTIRPLHETDQDVAHRLLGLDVQDTIGGGMLCFVAEYRDVVVGMLCGWLGRPYGHVQYCHLDPEASPRARVHGFLGLHQAFETALIRHGAAGWTAQTEAGNHSMIRMLTERGAATLPGERVVVMRRWR